MRKQLLTWALLGLAASYAVAAESEQERKEDIAKHRTMAAAHASAAQCLESGKDADSCMQTLQKTCKGLAIGKFCGMRHTH